MGDVMTAVHAYGAIGYALLHRERTGRGQYLEATLLDSYFHCHEESVVLASSSHGEIKPRRAGLHHETHCPVGLFKGKEHYLFIIAITLDQWKSLCAAMGKPELGVDPRFKTEPGRVAHKQFIIDTIQGWLASMPSDDAAVASDGGPSRAGGAGAVRGGSDRPSASAPARHRPHGYRSGCWASSTSPAFRCDSRTFPASFRWRRRLWVNTTRRYCKATWAIRRKRSRNWRARGC